jgi:hypothetical protein
MFHEINGKEKEERKKETKRTEYNQRTIAELTGGICKAVWVRRRHSIPLVVV